jgi:mannose-6-phosphate isomerase
MKLGRRYVEKPWGQTELPPQFDAPSGKSIGEVWFTSAHDLPILIKYLFTSERLSVQVHPSDEQARRLGLPSGKSECWYILDAEPGATIGLGLLYSISADELRAAALDGSIEQMMEWRPVAPGDFLFVPPGTIHAIGGGISLIEIQQNADVTYRLYDYGRPRELHVSEAVAVATREPYPSSLAQHLDAGHQRTLVDGPHFTLVLSNEDALAGRLRWIVTLEGEARSKTEVAGAGECLLLGAEEQLRSTTGRMLIAASV